MLIDAADAYLKMRRAFGFKLRNDEYLLRNFARFAAAQGETHIRGATAVTWAAQAPSMQQRDRRLKAVMHFASYLHAADPAHQIPPDHVFDAPHTRRLPHIYTPEELRRILEEAGQLGPTGSLRPHTYQTLFGILAACGLRISEALALEVDDITSDGLFIRETKFRKSRLVPMHPTTERAVDDYLRRRRKVAGSTNHLFVTLKGGPLRYPTVITVFLSLIRRLGLRGEPGESGPRLHDMRHTLSVRALEACSRDEVARHLLALSTYLGHVHVADTYWYLHATPQLLSGIADACREWMGVTP